MSYIGHGCSFELSMPKVFTSTVSNYHEDNLKLNPLPRLRPRRKKIVPRAKIEYLSLEKNSTALPKKKWVPRFWKSRRRRKFWCNSVKFPGNDDVKFCAKLKKNHLKIMFLDAVNFFKIACGGQYLFLKSQWKLNQWVFFGRLSRPIGRQQAANFSGLNRRIGRLSRPKKKV